MPLNENEYWDEEVFKINMILINVDAIDVQHSNLKAVLCCENEISNSIDLNLKEYDDTKIKLKFVTFPSNIRPFLSISLKLPDNRFKNQANNLIKMVTHEMVRENQNV